MAWNFRADLPIYSQLIDKLTRAIISGEYAAGSKLPSVRELAAGAGINPNTAQRAFGELEREGLIVTQRTAGKFVTDDEEKIKTAKKELAMEEIKNFFSSMQSLGFDREQVLAMLQEYREEA